MRYLTALLVALLAACAVYAGSTVVIIRRADTAPSCTTAGSAAFTADPQSDGSWNTDIEEDGTGLTWDSGNENESNTAAGGGTMNALTYTATASDTSNMWVKAKIVSVPSGGNFGIVFRRSTSTSARYLIKVRQNDVSWYYWDGDRYDDPSSIATLSGCGTVSDGDVIAAYVTGTGTGTVLKVWKNPSGATPTEWGDANACATDTTDPANAVNSGTYGGLYGNTVGGTRYTMVYDDFSVGSCS